MSASIGHAGSRPDRRPHSTHSRSHANVGVLSVTLPAATGGRSIGSSLLVLEDGLESASAVGLETFLQGLERVPAVALHERHRDLPRHGRLSDRARGRDAGHVAALVARRLRLAGLEVGGRERLDKRRDRLHGAADDERLPVRDSALDPARVVGGAAPSVAVARDRVVDQRARLAARVEPVPDLDGLLRLDRQDGLRQSAIETTVALRVAAQSDGDARRDDLVDAPEGVAGLLGRLDVLDGRVREFLAQHPHRRLVRGLIQRPRAALEEERVTCLDPVIGVIEADLAQPHHVAPDLDAERPQHLAGNGAARDPHRRLPSRRTVDHRPDVRSVRRSVKAVLLSADEIGVSRPGQRDLLDSLPVAGDGHLLGPAGPVLLIGRVWQQQRDGTPHRVREPNPAEHAHAVLLELGAPSASVPEPPSRQVLIEVGRGDGNACRHSLDDPDEGFAVGLAGGEVAHG